MFVLFNISVEYECYQFPEIFWSLALNLYKYFFRNIFLTFKMNVNNFLTEALRPYFLHLSIIWRFKYIYFSLFFLHCFINVLLSWKILNIADNVYKGCSLSFVSRLLLWYLIATFRPHTTGLHQAILSIYWVGLFVPPWLLACRVSQTSLIGGFRSKALMVLSEEETGPSAVRCGGHRLLCCLIVCIHASGISIPLFCWCC